MLKFFYQQISLIWNASVPTLLRRVRIELVCFSFLNMISIQQTWAAVDLPSFEQTNSANQSIKEKSKSADFAQENPSIEARKLADWIAVSIDNKGLPFMIVDKKQAKAFVFDVDARLLGAAPVLLGIAIGDDSEPGVGKRKLSNIPQNSRTTPAGRFLASLDRSIHGDEILWVDYDAAISLHRVVTSNPKEHRAERLATPTPLDNRISFGCINVPPKFFDKVVSPTFKKSGIVYVLPETRSLATTFTSYGNYMNTQTQQRSETLIGPMSASTMMGK